MIGNDKKGHIKQHKYDTWYNKSNDADAENDVDADPDAVNATLTMTL